MSLVVVHVLDVYWLVLPALHAAGARPSWLDVAALLFVGGARTVVVGARVSRATVESRARA